MTVRMTCWSRILVTPSLSVNLDYDNEVMKKRVWKTCLCEKLIDSSKDYQLALRQNMLVNSVLSEWTCGLLGCFSHLNNSDKKKVVTNKARMHSWIHGQVMKIINTQILERNSQMSVCNLNSHSFFSLHHLNFSYSSVKA